MSAKAVIFVCVSVITIQIITGQCIRNIISNNGVEYIDNGLGLAGNAYGLTSNNYGLTANGYGLTGNNFGLTGNTGYGLASNGYGLASNSFGSGSNALAGYGGSGPDGILINGGGPFGTSSSSAYPPNGIAAQTDSMLYEGPLSVSGNMPFLGTVGFQGPLATAGAGMVSFGAGDGRIGINSETTGNGLAGGLGSGLGYTNGLGGGLAYSNGVGYSNGLGSGLAYGNGVGYPNGLTGGLGYGNGLAGGFAGGYGYGTGLAGGMNNGLGLGNGIGFTKGCSCSSV